MGQQQRRSAAVDLVIDLDPVTVDFWHCDFLQAPSVVCNGILEHDPEEWVPVSLGTNAIHSPVGTAQRRSGEPGFRLAWERPLSSISRPSLLPQRTMDGPELFLFNQFQFALPPDWNAIILLRKVGIGPVGA